MPQSDSLAPFSVPFRVTSHLYLLGFNVLLTSGKSELSLPPSLIIVCQHRQIGLQKQGKEESFLHVEALLVTFERIFTAVFTKDNGLQF